MAAAEEAEQSVVVVVAVKRTIVDVCCSITECIVLNSSVYLSYVLLAGAGLVVMCCGK